MRLRLPLLAALALAVGACDSTRNDGPPTRAEIVFVTVFDAPLRDAPAGNDTWDATDGPEIYFRLFDADVDLVTDPGSDRLNPRDDGEVFALNSDDPWYSNVDAGDFPLRWEVEPGYLVRDLDDLLYVGLFDYDATNSDDPMAETDEFRLSRFAPARVDGQIDVVDLGGIFLDGTAAPVDVRIGVVFRD